MAAGGRARGLIFLVASILGAAGVTFIVFNMVQQIRTAQKPQTAEAKADVVIAAVDIAPGWTITKEMLQTRNMEVSYIPQESIKNPEEVIGRVAMERVLFGEFVREDRLAVPEAGVGLAAIIPRGMRAFQVNVGTSQGMSGFLSPGNFVDVIVVCTKVEPPEARTILRSVTVLAVNDKMVDDDFKNPTEAAEDAKSSKKKKSTRIRPSVTLALVPEDTVLLKHATEECKVYLSLRNDIDVTNVESNDSNGEPTPQGPAAPAPMVEIEVPATEGADPAEKKEAGSEAASPPIAPPATPAAPTPTPPL
jgi:pilus assembly protein CpaB